MSAADLFPVECYELETALENIPCEQCNKEVILVGVLKI